MNDLYQEICVWKEVDKNTAIRYLCFLNLKSGMYCVHSADFFYLPINNKQIEFFSKQCVELFIEESPSVRCNWYGSILEAIEVHEAEF